MSRALWLVVLLALGLASDPALGTAVEAAKAGAEDATGEGHEKEGDHDGKHSSRLPDEKIPLQLEGFPERPGFLIELGNPYLGTGRIKKGKRLPTGAVWQPTLIAFGTFRTAVQTFEHAARQGAENRSSEVAARLDLFLNLQLSGTERLVVGFRPLDTDGLFTRYAIDPRPPDGDRWQGEFDGDIETLYFEGDFGEIFPNVDKEDFGRSDIGFAIGRQPLLFQEGMLINDSIDGAGFTRNTLLPKGTSNYRMTLFIGLDNVNRPGLAGPNLEDRDSELYALLTSTDFRRSTVDADLAYVTGSDLTGDLAVLGVSAVQRIGKVNTSFRILASQAIDSETAFSTDGVLLFSEVSWTPHYTYDHIYFTAFLAADQYSPAARNASLGGPLGRAGISFAAVGLGSFGAPLDNTARDAAGGAVGYQKFYGPLKRRQLLTELGVRVGTASSEPSAAALTARYQMALGRRTVLVFDAFTAYHEGLGGRSDETRVGGRFELLLKF